MRKKLLIISDHAMTTSGVATQSRHLIEGLLKTQKYDIVQLGAAIRHENYMTQDITDHFRIIPCNGFGNKDIVRSLLVKEKPDAMIIFTDPRFFGHIFEMEDEIHQVCPIMYWHVWDNRPTPRYNKKYYDAVDKVVAISKLTEAVCKDIVPEKTVYIPHTLPEDVYFQLEDERIATCKLNTLGEARKDNFIALWLNRNCRRKRAADVLKAWQIFLFNIEDKYKRKDATLIMHTNPEDSQGTNLLEIAKNLDILDNVCFSDQTATYEQINVLHNISDVCLNISYAEGFGLTTLESMKVGNPIIATTTGGLTTQVIDCKDGSHNGIPLTPKVKTISGSQDIHYIYEDYVTVEDTAYALVKMYEMGNEKRKELGQKCKKYVEREFNYENMIKSWDEEIEHTLSTWQENRTRITLEEI